MYTSFFEFSVRVKGLSVRLSELASGEVAIARNDGVDTSLKMRVIDKMRMSKLMQLENVDHNMRMEKYG